MNTPAQDFRVKALFALALCAAVPGALATDTVISSNITTNGAFAVASGDTVTVTGNVTSTGDSTSARFDKQGAGTLVLQGDNSFKRIKQSAGKLVFDGGTTTVSGGSGTGSGNDMNVILWATRRSSPAAPRSPSGPLLACTTMTAYFRR